MKTKTISVFPLIAAAMFLFGCASGGRKQSTISVSGTGTVMAQPDIIQMRITLRNIAQTTKLAQNAVSRMVRQALTVLKDAGIEDKNIMTASLNFGQEYDYSGKRVLIGQRAEQSIAFSIDNINNNSERLSEIIDKLIQIDGIELNQVNFSVKNSTEYFTRARELAFQKAVEKANQYAGLSNLRVAKVLTVSENAAQPIMPIYNRAMNSMMDAAAEGKASSTVVPMGELEVTTQIFIEFLLE